MDLSVVIVSYNVLPFLRQCIHAVSDACEHVSHEILVIDNNSTDGSTDYLSNISDESISVILNPTNTGYGSAMNQGIFQAKGDFLLLLNPDTIITRESVALCLDKLKADEKCGAVGVRMIDGHGNYLKESKRGYPTPLSSFYKISGLSSLFPKSQHFAHYNQGHLDPKSNHSVDILTGAFLLTRTKMIRKLGGFDERYFMYGEDIDLSYTITQAGYNNYYMGETSIIHFKGESTIKGSLKNTFHFYNSMLLFTKKYSSGNFIYIGLLSLLLTLIGVAKWIKINLLPILKPIIRYGIYVAVLALLSKLWANYYFNDSSYFAYRRHTVLIMIYAGVLNLGYYLGDKGLTKLQNLIWASIAILAVYSLLPLSLRSSRAVIILGAGSIFLLEVLLQAWSAWKRRGSFAFWNYKRRALLLGAFDECSLALESLKSQQSYHYEGIVSDSLNDDQDCITSFDHLENYLSKNTIDTMTIHMESMPMSRIMAIISEYGSAYQYLLYSSKNKSIIDSPDSNIQGNVSLVEIRWAISSPLNKGVKRSIDIIASISFILLMPCLIWFVKNRLGWLQNIYQSLVGKTSWVGYSNEDPNIDQLPKLKPAVIQLNHEPGNGHYENVSYARDYSFLKDVSLIFNSFTALGNKV